MNFRFQFFRSNFINKQFDMTSAGSIFCWKIWRKFNFPFRSDTSPENYAAFGDFSWDALGRWLAGYSINELFLRNSITGQLCSNEWRNTYNLMVQGCEFTFGDLLALRLASSLPELIIFANGRHHERFNRRLSPEKCHPRWPFELN